MSKTPVLRIVQKLRMSGAERPGVPPTSVLRMADSGAEWWDVSLMSHSQRVNQVLNYEVNILTLTASFCNKKALCNQ